MTIGEKYIPTQDKVVWYSDDGTMLYGWQNIDGKVHYFDKITGKMTTGQKNIDGHWYLFDSKGVCNKVSKILVIKIKLFTTMKTVGCYMAGKIRRFTIIKMVGCYMDIS